MLENDQINCMSQESPPTTRPIRQYIRRSTYVPKTKGMRWSENPERAAEIVRRINGGEFAINLAKELGISRERVRQIYKKETGHGTRHLRTYNLRLQKAAARKVFLASVKFICQYCKKPVRFGDTPRNMRTFCFDCRQMVNQRQLDLQNLVVCDGCGITYPPYRTTRGKYRRHFHDIDCYNKNKSGYLYQKNEVKTAPTKSSDLVYDEQAGVERFMAQRRKLKQDSLKTPKS